MVALIQGVEHHGLFLLISNKEARALLHTKKGATVSGSLNGFLHVLEPSLKTYVFTCHRAQMDCPLPGWTVIFLTIAESLRLFPF